MHMNESATLAGAAPGRFPLPATLAIVAALLAPFLIYAGTAASMVAIWNSSETFAHGYIILPISLYLIWRRRAAFGSIGAEPCWPALGLLALCGAGWLLARMGEVQVVMQYAFVAMIPLVALAVLGWRLARKFAFPLGFLLFAVPFGEAFVPHLINITADFTVAAVRASGIPVLRNGTFFELPTGSWSVVEACSGVRYLISSITLGCLYAYLSFTSLTRRAVFIALSVVVPIVANGLRAYMIVMIGHHSSMQLATGVDHLVYGWLFFGLVMFIMFWIGSYWRQEEPPIAAAAAATAPAALLVKRPLTGVAIAAIAVCALWPALAAYADRVNHNPAPVRLDDSRLAWRPAVAAPLAAWAPDYDAPAARLGGGYAGANGQAVTLHLLYYRNQERGKNLITSTNRLSSRGDQYLQVGSSARTEQVGGRTLALREARVKGPAGQQFLVWHWMWIDGGFIANDYVGKLRQAKSKLLMQGDDGAALLVAAPYSETPDSARATMRAFLDANLAPLEATLGAARGR